MIIRMKEFGLLFRDFVKSNDLTEKVAESSNAFVIATKEVHDGLAKMGHKFSADVETYCRDIKSLQARTINKLGKDKKLRSLV